MPKVTPRPSIEPKAVLKRDLYAVIGFKPCSLINIAAIAIATKTATIGINQEPTSNFFVDSSDWFLTVFLSTFVSLIIGYPIRNLK